VGTFLWLMAHGGGAVGGVVSVELRGQNVHAVTVAPGVSSLAYAATDSGVYVSSDALHWRRILNQPSYALAASPEASRTIYAGGPRGLWRSSDAGRSWTEERNPAGAPIWLVATDPNDPSTVWVAASDPKITDELLH